MAHPPGVRRHFLKPGRRIALYASLTLTDRALPSQNSIFMYGVSSGALFWALGEASMLFGACRAPST